jgi:glycosyltransferase involved in cell wall biosynthesis
MRILYVTKKKRNAWNGTLHKPLQQELNKRKNIKVVDRMPDRKTINENYDAFFADVEIHVRGWQKLKIPKVMFMEDVWIGGQKRKGKSAARVFKHADAIMVRYKAMFDKKVSRKNFIPRQPIFWLPHCISPQLFRDWKQEKIYDTLSVGNLLHKSTQDMRIFFHKTTKKGPWTSFRAEANRHTRAYKAHAFSKVINRSRITGTSNTVWQVLAKCFEIPASRSLMFSNYSEDMERLGFIDGENYVLWDKENLVDKLNYYLGNPDELHRITDNGFKMVHENHRVGQRARQWIEIMEEVINK